MSVSTPFRSPLHLLVLALLREHPMHVYGLHKLIHDRGQDGLVNVEHRNSIRQAVERLERQGSVAVDGVQSGTGPQRTVYRVTDAGRRALEGWLRELLAEPRREYPVFVVVASLMAFLPVAEVATLLASRQEQLTAERQELGERTRAADLPAILLVENDLRSRFLQAEISWIDDTLTRIASGELTWDTAALLDASPMPDVLTHS